MNTQKTTVRQNNTKRAILERLPFQNKDILQNHSKKKIYGMGKIYAKMHICNSN